MDPVGTGIALARELRERSRQQRTDEEARLKHRLELKAELSAKLPHRTATWWPELIVRDVARLDKYPEGDNAFRGVSPWFKVEAFGLYHRGLEVALRWERAVLENGVARCIDTNDGETILVVGRIPLDGIVLVDWTGDEFYPVPHLYCRFEFDCKAYESIEVYRPIEGSNHFRRLSGVQLKDRPRPLRQRPSEWRAHRQMVKFQREFEREVNDTA